MRGTASWYRSRSSDSSDVATVYCIVPVHNRLEITRRFVLQIRRQSHKNLVLVIVDDGSTDGTTEFLHGESRPGLVVLHGSGDLWWGGSMNLGLEYVFRNAGQDDYILMLNDDVRIADSYVGDLVSDSNAANGAVIGSAQWDEVAERWVAPSIRINHWSMRLEGIPHDQRGAVPGGLPARGLLIPLAAARAAGYIHRWFPHYLGDLDYTARLRDLGYELRVSEAAVVRTEVWPGETRVQDMAGIWRLFGIRSKNNPIRNLQFFMLHGGLLLQLLAVPRFLLAGVFKFLLQR